LFGADVEVARPLSPDGQRLAFVQPAVLIPVSGGTAREAARFKGGRGDSLQRLAFLPDGKSVVVARTVGVDEGFAQRTELIRVDLASR
jgi:hypothetical protein